MMSDRRKRHPLTDEEKHTLETDVNAQGYAPMRRGDLSRWWRAFENLQKYAVAYALVAAIATAFGFVVVTPKRVSSELSNRIDSSAIHLTHRIDAVQAQIDSGTLDRQHLREQHEAIEREFSLLIRMACQDKFTSTQQKQLIGLIDNHGDCIK